MATSVYDHHVELPEVNSGPGDSDAGDNTSSQAEEHHGSLNEQGIVTRFIDVKKPVNQKVFAIFLAPMLFGMFILFCALVYSIAGE